MIFYILSSIGLTFILKYGSILNWLRNILIKNKFFKELFSCSLCLGFWTGAFIGVIGGYIEHDIRFILLPLVSSACNWFADGMIGVIQNIEVILTNKINNCKDDDWF